jgi:Flp pilus assembly protein TadG
VEFALVAPPFLMLLLGIIGASVVVFSAASMHFAAEGAARWYSVNDSVNASPRSTAATAQSYARNLYFGVSSPTFTASLISPGCGHQVSATLSLVLNAGIAKWTVPLNATACFP